MQKPLFMLGLILGFAFCTAAAQAELIDLTTFTTDTPGSVQESGGAVTFTENDTDVALYFYSNSFSVSPSATKLTFDVDLVYFDQDQTDYVAFAIRNAASPTDILYEWFQDTPGNSHADIDLTPYQGTDIAIEWGLIWNFDTTGSQAVVSNIQIEHETAPVPEPGTLLLLVTGLAGLARFGRNRKS